MVRELVCLKDSANYTGGGGGGPCPLAG